MESKRCRNGWEAQSGRLSDSPIGESRLIGLDCSHSSRYDISDHTFSDHAFGVHSCGLPFVWNSISELTLWVTLCSCQRWSAVITTEPMVTRLLDRHKWHFWDTNLHSLTPLQRFCCERLWRTSVWFHLISFCCRLIWFLTPFLNRVALPYSSSLLGSLKCSFDYNCLCV